MRLPVLVCAGVILAGLAGCGAGGRGAPGDSPPPSDQPLSPSTEVGPFVIHTTATSGLQMRTLSNDGDATFVTVHGATIDHVVVQEMLDQIVFSSYRATLKQNIWVCDLFGENLHCVSDTTGYADTYPTWGPAGDRIAFVREWAFPGPADIYVMDADGGNVDYLTTGSSSNTAPTWSPSGDRIAFQTNRDGNWEIYGVYLDRSGLVNLTNDVSADYEPDWSPDRTSGGIAFSSARYGSSTEIFTMLPNGSNVTRVTTSNEFERRPAWSPDGSLIAFDSYLAAMGKDIHEVTAYGGARGALADTHHDEVDPCYSHDGRFLAYTSAEGGGNNIWVRELAPPGRRYRVTDGNGQDMHPDLGNPRMQTSRVLVGPNGADRGHDPPMQPAVAYGAVMAFGENGYLNFVRIGINSWRANTLAMTPQTNAGTGLVALKVTAEKLNALHQDNGAGEAPSFWDLAATNTSAALLLFNAETGKLASVLSLHDEVYPTAEDTSGPPTVREEGGRTIIEGSFSAVYDASGNLVEEGHIGAVAVDPAAGTASVL